MSLERFEGEPKEPRLSDEQFGNLIAAIGNHEAKAVTLLTMRTGIIYTAEQLHQAVINAQGVTPGWRIHHQSPFVYCQRSLAPIGLVAQEVVAPGLNTFGYIRTTYGENVGMPLAGLLLDFSRRNEGASLYRIFGATVSTSPIKEDAESEEGLDYRKRSPIVRFNMFLKLLTSKLPMRETDLAESIGERRDYLRNHLHQLARHNIITYESVKRGQAYSVYKASLGAPDTAPPRSGRRTFLTPRVHQVFVDNPGNGWTAPDVVDHLISRGYYDIQYRVGLVNQVSGVLSHLTRHKYLEAPAISMASKSAINLTDEQRSLLSDIVGTLSAYREQTVDILERGRRLASDFLVNPSAVSEVMLRARDQSPFVSASTNEFMEGAVLAIIQGHPGITSTEIASVLEKEYDKKVVVGRVKQLTKSLREQGLVTGSKEKITIKWQSNS